jgi:hypothetical protein
MTKLGGGAAVNNVFDWVDVVFKSVVTDNPFSVAV